MKERLTVVKIGGNVADNPEALKRFLGDFAALPGRKVLVHGGGKEATKLSAALGIETTMIEGRRVTGRDTLDVVTMVYAGLVNKRMVAGLQSLGCDAIGLTGADGRAVVAKRRPAQPIDYGYVGDIYPEEVNATFIMQQCAEGRVPVFCAIMYDGAGGLLNCNADSVATAMALGMAREAEVDLVFCFEKKGVLRDVEDPDSVIAQISPANYGDLRSGGVISKGMVPKIDNALKAVAQGVSSVRICHSDDLLNAASGTTIVNA